MTSTPVGDAEPGASRHACPIALSAGQRMLALVDACRCEARQLAWWPQPRTRIVRQWRLAPTGRP
ncbi:hypothetical protein, partial [Cupriavidus basilensis]|uniref:hypothetical protein n=1 Tax=Cupriavidus basilensis TaxID=68895 RepID=UPI0023E8F1D8